MHALLEGGAGPLSTPPQPQPQPQPIPNRHTTRTMKTTPPATTTLGLPQRPTTATTGPRPPGRVTRPPIRTRRGAAARAAVPAARGLGGAMRAWRCGRMVAAASGRRFSGTGRWGAGRGTPFTKRAVRMDIGWWRSRGRVTDLVWCGAVGVGGSESLLGCVSGCGL